MAGGRRSTASRTARPPAPPSGTANMLAMGPRKDDDPALPTQYPQAVPIPDIPHDSSLTFEIIMFIYVTAALGLQYLNLYRYSIGCPKKILNAKK